MNKASVGDGIPVELFQILKDDAVKVLNSIYQQIWKTQQWPQDWKRSVFIPIPISKMVRIKAGMEQQLSGGGYLPAEAQVQTDTGQKVWTTGQSWVLREPRRGLTLVGSQGWGVAGWDRTCSESNLSWLIGSPQCFLIEEVIKTQVDRHRGWHIVGLQIMLVEWDGTV